MENGNGAASAKKAAPRKKTKTSDTRRHEHLQTVLSHCLAAKKIADDKGEKFLSYMLSMTIEEVQKPRT